MKLTFFLSAKTDAQDIDLSMVAKELDLQDCILRKRADYPQATILAGAARDQLCYEIRDENQDLLANMVDLLQAKLAGRAVKVRQLCEELLMSAGVEVVIYQTNEESASLILSLDNILFLASLQAEFAIVVEKHNGDYHKFVS
ncbi:MAG: DUF4279 domain-containing protein [Erysipelotrichaceae bacterium]|nr:DUF4279 domain-containing protein [Erysipelotrichaceae bacterium]